MAEIQDYDQLQAKLVEGAGGRTTSTGTGTLLITSDLPNLEPLSTALTDGSVRDFWIEYADGVTTGYELISAQWQASPAGILRTGTPIKSSNAGARVDFQSGTKNIYCVASRNTLSSFLGRSYSSAQAPGTSPEFSQSIPDKTWTTVKTGAVQTDKSDWRLWLSTESPAGDDATWIIDTSTTAAGLWSFSGSVAWENTVTSPLMPVHRRKLRVVQSYWTGSFWLPIPTSEAELLYHPDMNDLTGAERHTVQQIYTQPGVNPDVFTSRGEYFRVYCQVWHNAGIAQNLVKRGIVAPLQLTAKLSEF